MSETYRKSCHWFLKYMTPYDLIKDCKTIGTKHKT